MKTSSSAQPSVHQCATQSSHQSTHRSTHQSGSVLLEALFGILIFSMGILALIGLQATSVQQVSSGKYRTEASLLANELLGQMWVSDRTPATLAAAFSSPDGAAYLSWKAEVAGVLPNVQTYPPTVTIATVTGSSVLNTHSQVTINLRWKTPNAATADPTNSYTLVAQIK